MDNPLQLCYIRQGGKEIGGYEMVITPTLQTLIDYSHRIKNEKNIFRKLKLQIMFKKKVKKLWKNKCQ